MKENTEIKDFGTHDTGMRVPDGYFADFNCRMEALIDQEDSHGLAPKISLWSKVKPWMYMAATFVAFVVMFRVLIDPTAKEERSVQMAALEEQAVYEDVLYASVSDYDIYEYLYADGE